MRSLSKKFLQFGLNLISVSVLTTVLTASLAGCSLFARRNDVAADAAQKKTALDQALSKLSLERLDQANTVFRVAFEKSLDTWQGPDEFTVPGCKISGRDAENGLAAVKPWFERRVTEEAKRAVDSPKSYVLPFDVEVCERNCSCGVGVAILDVANLDSLSHQKVKDLKRLRTRLEAKAELLTRDRAELCAESATWLCSSEVLKALQPTPQSR